MVGVLRARCVSRGGRRARVVARRGPRVGRGARACRLKPSDGDLTRRPSGPKPLSTLIEWMPLIGRDDMVFLRGRLPARSARTGPRSRLPAMCWIPGGFGRRDLPRDQFFSGRARAAVHGLQPRNCWEADSAWSRREQTREGDAVQRLVHASESLERLATRRRLGLQQLMLQHCLCPSQARVVAAGAASRCSVHSRAVARHHGRDAASRSCVFFLARRMPGRALVGSWWITIKSIDACSIWKPHSNRCHCLWQPLHAAHLVRAHDLRRGAVLFGEENSHAEA